MSAEKKYTGNVEITERNAAEWAKKLEGVEQITGYLWVDSSAKLDAPALQSVGGDLRVDSSAKLDAPALQSVGGYLRVDSSAKLDAPALQSVGGYLWVYGSAKLDAPALQSVGGYLRVDSSAELGALQSVGGYLRVYGSLNEDTEHLLWKKYRSKRKWYLSDKSSDFLLSKNPKAAEYRINNVVFDRALFNKVRLGKLKAAEVFSITNTEQRRVAYERLDKSKMAELPNLEVLDEVANDGYGYPMRVISFTLNGYKEPFRYLNCFCPSTGREYYLETQQQSCEAAKSASFGINANFDAEY